MQNEILYMSGVVGVGIGITFMMRLLPFMLFSGGKDGAPAWAENLGRIISPLIIAALIIYSYSALRWRTPWPYIAGGVTVLFHLRKKNALLSILAGTALYSSLLFFAGCMTNESSLSYNSKKPLITFTNNGLKFQDEFVTPQEAVKRLEKHKIPKNETLHLLVEEDYTNKRATWVFQRNYLSRAGYTKSILVHATKAESTVSKNSKPKAAKQIRYKQSSEE